MQTAKISEDAILRIEGLIHNEYSPATYITHKGFDTSLGEGYFVAPDNTGRGFVLHEPDGSETYAVQVWGPSEAYNGYDEDTGETTLEPATVSWASYGDNPTGEVARKWAMVVTIASHYAEALDRLAADIIKEDA